MFSELSEKELNQLFVMDEYGVENSHFTVHEHRTRSLEILRKIMEGKADDEKM